MAEMVDCINTRGGERAAKMVKPPIRPLGLSTTQRGVFTLRLEENDIPDFLSWKTFSNRSYGDFCRQVLVYLHHLGGHAHLMGYFCSKSLSGPMIAPLVPDSRAHICQPLEIADRRRYLLILPPTVCPFHGAAQASTDDATVGVSSSRQLIAKTRERCPKHLDARPTQLALSCTLRLVRF